MFWLNGEYKDNLAIDPRDRGFLLGDGLFETILVKNGAPVFLEAHLARMKASLAALNIRDPIPPETGKIIGKLASANDLARGRSAARMTVSRGVSDRGLVYPEPEQQRPTCLIGCAPMPTSDNDKYLILAVSSFLRSRTSIASKHKTLNYLDSLMARNEALKLGADEAVMLNEQGRIACCSSANIFFIDDAGTVITPPRSEGALNGIVRGLLLGGVKEHGVEIREKIIPQESLQSGFCFLTNSLIGIRAACLKESKQKISAQQRRIFNQLTSWYDDQVVQDLDKRVAYL